MKSRLERIATIYKLSAMSADDFLKEIESEFKKNFSKGWFEPSKGALGGGIYVKSGIQSKNEHSNGIKENDPAYQIIVFNGVELGKDLPEKFMVEVSTGGSLTVKPEEGSHMAQGRVKFGWRKKTGTPEQILKHMKNYFSKMKKVYKANKSNMFDYHSKGI